jgi:hypothetical protein
MNSTLTIPFQMFEPLYVNREFDGHGRTWKVGQEFKWREMMVEEETVRILFYNDFLRHDFTKAKKDSPIGDGYETLPLESLQAKVDKINEVVATIEGLTAPQRAAMKCKKSRNHGQQIGIIRTWKNRYYEDLGKKGYDLEV